MNNSQSNEAATSRHDRSEYPGHTPEKNLTPIRGIILAGGYGTRLFPLTIPVVKQLLPVYDKPMVYYPLSMLMLAGIREILVISTPQALPGFEALLKDGNQWGLSFDYVAQPVPRGLADAFLIKPDFVRQNPVCLILGDNIFFGHGLPQKLRAAAHHVQSKGGALIYAYPVRDPERYGVIEFDESGKALSIEEKPSRPRSKYAVPGLYFYDGQVVDIARNLKPSARNELEITDLNQTYLAKGELFVEELGRGVAWLDMGTHESLLQAANFVQAVENRQGMMISCPEEIAFRMGYIDRGQLALQGESMKSNQYGEYLLRLARNEIE
jgi:glucose-1-phosphate thymidylyltransferase